MAESQSVPVVSDILASVSGYSFIHNHEPGDGAVVLDFSRGLVHCLPEKSFIHISLLKVWSYVYALRVNFYVL